MLIIEGRMIYYILDPRKIEISIHDNFGAPHYYLCKIHSWLSAVPSHHGLINPCFPPTTRIESIRGWRFLLFKFWRRTITKIPILLLHTYVPHVGNLLRTLVSFFPLHFASNQRHTPSQSLLKVYFVLFFFSTMKKSKKASIIIQYKISSYWNTYDCFDLLPSTLRRQIHS